MLYNIYKYHLFIIYWFAFMFLFVGLVFKVHIFAYLSIYLFVSFIVLSGFKFINILVNNESRF